MYSPLTPTHQYSTAQLQALPKTNEGIVDLSSVMEDYKEPFKAYEKIIKDLQQEIKNEKAEHQKANNKLDEFMNKYNKLDDMQKEQARVNK